MAPEKLKQFRRGEKVYFISDMAEKLSHLQGELLEDVMPDTRVIRILNDQGAEVAIRSDDYPQWNHLENVEGTGLLFLKQGVDQVVYIIVSQEQNSLVIEPDIDL